MLIWAIGFTVIRKGKSNLPLCTTRIQTRPSLLDFGPPGPEAHANMAHSKRIPLVRLYMFIMYICVRLAVGVSGWAWGALFIYLSCGFAGQRRWDPEELPAIHLPRIYPKQNSWSSSTPSIFYFSAYSTKLHHNNRMNSLCLRYLIFAFRCVQWHSLCSKWLSGYCSMYFVSLRCLFWRILSVWICFDCHNRC